MVNIYLEMKTLNPINPIKIIIIDILFKYYDKFGIDSNKNWVNSNLLPFGQIISLVFNENIGICISNWLEFNIDPSVTYTRNIKKVMLKGRSNKNLQKKKLGQLI